MVSLDGIGIDHRLALHPLGDDLAFVDQPVSLRPAEAAFFQSLLQRNQVSFLMVLVHLSAHSLDRQNGSLRDANAINVDAGRAQITGKLLQRVVVEGRFVFHRFAGRCLLFGFLVTSTRGSACK